MLATPKTLPHLVASFGTCSTIARAAKYCATCANRVLMCRSSSEGLANISETIAAVLDWTSFVSRHPVEAYTHDESRPFIGFLKQFF